MISYSLQLEDGTKFPINGEGATVQLRQSASLGDFAHSKKSTIVERSYGDGSLKVGVSRSGASSMQLSMDLSFLDNGTARIFLNNILAYARDAVYLVDETNFLRTRIDMSEPSVTWDDGSYLRSGSLSIVFVQLIPYWESTAETTAEQAVTAIVPVVVPLDNTGFADTPFIVDVAVETACAYVEIQDIDVGTILRFDSASFGASGFSTLRIDNDKGSAILLNDDGVTQLDVIASASDGSGFFNLRRGVNELTIRAEQDATFSFSFRKRYFV